MDCTIATEHAVAAHHIITCITPPSTPWWLVLPSAVSALLGIFALTVAIASLHASRKIARDKSTLDLIEKRESTEHYRKINRTFSILRQSTGFLHLTGNVEKNISLPGRNNRDDRQDVIDYLNHYELVAIGIERKLLNGETYREWMKTAFVRDWNAAADWVQEERWELIGDCWHYHETVLAAYQAIACSWSSDARNLDRNSGRPSKTAILVAPVSLNDEMIVFLPSDDA
ncbi:MAG: DUF4760 domain-containing protein [Sphingomonas sp.]|nr:DUF4760 domain-containing protein [Sphingomonas sp.]